MMTYDYYTPNKTIATLLSRVLTLIVCFWFSTTTPLQAQIIGGNVYGGGNQGDVDQNTTVELKSGFIHGNVFGGAREANVNGRAYVNIDATNTLVIKSVYGGNDVSGTIGVSSENLPFTPQATEITKEWNALVRVTKNTTHPVIIGTLYGGGNGDYEYDDESKKPILRKTYIELNGGIYGSIYGGGNNATVTDRTVIYTALNGTLDQISKVYEGYASLLGLAEGDDYTINGDNMVFNYHANRVFGGNNLATMGIRPTWHLQNAKINNLYSGGNRGAMTSPNGLLLTLQSDGLSVNNVYGGCRMADVNPGMMNGTETIGTEIFDSYSFLADYASRVYITAGNIINVYGGNDISGKVYHGTYVVIRSNILGDIYGGGNGSYAYTDNINNANSDLYYDPNTAASSLDALYLHRPHIEKSYIHIAAGENADHPTIIQKNVYCGGNSATLAVNGDQSKATATLKIDRNVTINSVFLGSNGANMVEPTILAQYANPDYNSIGLTLGDDIDTKIAKYMTAVSVHNLPKVEWDTNVNYTTRIGSFFCGGNKGSMTYTGSATMGSSPNTLTFPDSIVIYDKIVAGCNDASFIVDDRIVYEGGLTGAPDVNGNKVRLNVLSRLEPYETQTVSYQDADGLLNKDKDIYLKANIYGGCYTSGQVNGNVEINIATDLISPNLDENIINASGDYINASTLAVYGGGYGKNSIINGNTKINLSNNARVLLVFGGGEMGSVTGNTTVNLDKALTSIGNKLNVYKAYAGGYAGPVEGNTTLNLYGGSVMSAFAGACNANIGGSSEIIVGHNDNIGKGLPYVTHAVYGGNDFGGTIIGNRSYTIDVNDDVTKNVRTQTYVQYICGKIGKAIYGGSYGSYDYKNTALYPEANHKRPALTAVFSAEQDDAEDIILTNTFVDIASLSVSTNDVIGSDNLAPLTLIGGGGRGYKGLPDSVEVEQTYVLLHSRARDNGVIAQRIYGGGNLSKVNNTLVDAYTGSYGTIFGGTHGVETNSVGDLDASYDCGKTEVNIYSGIEKNDLDIYGAGANSGATDTATVNLHGGRVRNVYGGALAEGYTANTKVNVLNNSTVRAYAIFGGGQGETDSRPCDVGQSFVTFASTAATVEDGIYGGNHNARATEQTLVSISAPVKDQYGNFRAIYGAGYGENTVAGFTNIILEPGAEVANVYGGGRNGQVYNNYSYYDSSEAFGEYASNNKHASWTTADNEFNTRVEIIGNEVKRARVMQNAYGAGYGQNASTSGKTSVLLLGGKVEGDIYGGGFEGTMPIMTSGTKGYINGTIQTIATLDSINGGDVRNVFGGGYVGMIEGDTRVAIGNKSGNTFYNGAPTILRSAYGGGEVAAVSGTATVCMYNGYIGYKYDGINPNPYKELLDLTDEGDNLLKENGNLYGAGYGEGAVVMKTKVNLYGGTIRNGLYGGGEIAAVGRGVRNNDGITYTINAGGETNVYMYGGNVEGDVFGGGRGYSYDLTGNQIIGKLLYSNGYVFGKTNVEIYRGKIGTAESVKEGHGNVFGGGNIGYVYSAGKKYTNETSGTMIKGHYYYKGDDPTTAVVETTADRTEDCRVHIAAGSIVTNDTVRIGSKTYKTGDFVPNSALNLLPYPDARWDNLDDEGVTIYNAVFAGGNVSAGSDKVYANAVTVFGNATASVVDVFSRDIVSLGGEHIGGLYGDGNLTFVDGYRELNITNYGTDYYHLNPEGIKKSIDSNAYHALSKREQEYYTTEKEGETIKYTISRTSGRIMNTIQRADFCGVFGSRILLYGAQDRVPDVADYTNYTINRVKEVSLNQKSYDTIAHGNYFGIYNVVNLLGALTSDVDFTASRQGAKYPYIGNVSTTTDPTTNETYTPGATYYDFKLNNFDKGFRNNAKSHNMVALASGVYLELVEEKTENKITGDVTKVYGPVTGVIELDLINVKTGEGGGYVYAKNRHNAPNRIDDPEVKKHFTLSTANADAITQTNYKYEGSIQTLQTSGNFVHETYRIIDDCFPNGGDTGSPAHFWCVMGNYYVYDQILSAYTGGANSYSQSINIPFTITDRSNGKVQITSIKPNKFFVGANGSDSFKFGNKVYNMNDAISYWDWSQLPNGYKGYFADMTYIAQATVDGSYEKGDVIDKTDYDSISSPEIQEKFRISNEMSHDNGYLLTFGMTNPLEWDNYYTNKNDKTDKLLGSALAGKEDEEQKEYLQAPTIECTESGIFGQRIYNSEDLVSSAVFEEHKLIAESQDANIQAAYQELEQNKPQAIFERAYVATTEIVVGNTSYNIGSYISVSAYNALTTDAQRNAFEPAYICTQTIEVADKDFVLNGDLISTTRYNELNALTSQPTDAYMYGTNITDHFSPAYVCVRQDAEDDDTYYYGGTYFNAGKNYSALDICALPNSDRTKLNVHNEPVFKFNKDALDLFFTNFSDDITEYGSPYYEENQYLYVDFTATYTGSANSLKQTDGSNKAINNGDVLNREEYQLLLNEQSHYVKVSLSENTNYIVKTQFKHNSSTYLVGQIIDQATYNSLGSNQQYIYPYDNSTTGYTDAYFCRENYNSSLGATVELGNVIEKDVYDNLPNYQKEFTIVGRAATETSTLYVPRESDIENLSKDRIITVQMDYIYNENGEEKLEKHVINIHVQFKSGQPSIGSVTPPATVLPNTTVGLSVPSVIPGAYEIIGGGWEIFKNEADARAHKNGGPYRNNATAMYWYQNGYYVAYYAKTYLGKVYSNPVPFSIANFHRMSEVMEHPEYMYIDHEHASRARAPKIYLDDATDLKLLNNLFQETVKNDSRLDTRVEGCANLDFILRKDIDVTESWTSIGNETACFEGTLHGNGYTINGINQSLFGYLCGEVYNLGVTGEFVGGGIADIGGTAENCWVSATGSGMPTTNEKDAVIGKNGIIENCYYLDENNNEVVNGTAIPKSATEFAKGEVTYMLNKYHVDKLYSDGQSYNSNGYVEKYYADGDFIYAKGEIPLHQDERYDEGLKKYIPIDDDYIFFGQRLTYNNATHGSVPTRIIKSVNNLGSELIDKTENGNRVYRAPAYYMSNVPQKVYFNTAARFVDTYNSMDIHQGLTAIDFTDYKVNSSDASYLDYEGLEKITIAGQTPNLLVYADPINDSNSYSKLNTYLSEPALKLDDEYLNVAPQTQTLSGHLVDLRDGEYIATRDHFLVDKENFNVPIAYEFAGDKHMWYQRTPEHFANRDGKGWDIVCLPFTAKNVTTHQKGEITHFYEGSKINHEYWLRELSGIETTTQNDVTTTEAAFASLDVAANSRHIVDNTFLNDYYYSLYDQESNQQDTNGDSYHSYYGETRTYAGYPFLQANTPYIIAFPGESYYEFDMSGKFVPENTGTTINKLDKQVVTMISGMGAKIGVTDNESRSVIKDNYQFVGTYQKKNIAKGYMITESNASDKGTFFQEIGAGSANTVPFRGYLVATDKNNSPKRIYIGSAKEENKPIEDNTTQGLIIYSNKNTIYIESTMDEDTTVYIYNTAGILIKQVIVHAMSKEEVPVETRGIYIVNRQKVAIL